MVVNALAARETIRRIAITPAYPDSTESLGENWGAAEIEQQRGKDIK